MVVTLQPRPSILALWWHVAITDVGFNSKGHCSKWSPWIPGPLLLQQLQFTGPDRDRDGRRLRDEMSELRLELEKCGSDRRWETGSWSVRQVGDGPDKWQKEHVYGTTQTGLDWLARRSQLHIYPFLVALNFDCRFGSFYHGYGYASRAASLLGEGHLSKRLLRQPMATLKQIQRE